MIPFLTYPLALIALASIPALTAIYLLRNRFRRRQVSSLMLWQFQVRSNEGGTRVQRLQLPWLFFLELLALLLLVIAATGPHWNLPQSSRPLVVILDDSFSMRAPAGPAAARERARQFLFRLIERSPPLSTRVLLAGTEPRLAGSPARTRAELETLLEQWTCWAPAAALETALSRAVEMGGPDANLLVLTDHAPMAEKLARPRLVWRAFGEPAPNIAFVGAARSANGEQDRCLLEVQNFSTAPALATVRVRSATQAVHQTALHLAPRERQRLIFSVPGSAPLLNAGFDADALEEDGQVQLLAANRRRVRVQVAFTNAALGSLVARALDATGLRAAISADPELIIHDGDKLPGSHAWSVRWLVPEKAEAYTGPFVADDRHPLMQGMNLAGAIWAAGSGSNAAPGAVPVLLAGNIPLIAVREDLVGRRFVSLNLDAGLSTVQSTPAWPVLFWNLLAWRAAELPGIQEPNVRLGADVILNAGSEAVTITRPDGEVRTFAAGNDRIAVETPMPGLYAVSWGSGTNLLAVNALAAEESDLMGCRTGRWGTWQEPDLRLRASSPLAWLFALGALLVLTAHLYWVCAGKEGG